MWLESYLKYVYTLCIRKKYVLVFTVHTYLHIQKWCVFFKLKQMLVTCHTACGHSSAHGNIWWLSCWWQSLLCAITPCVMWVRMYVMFIIYLSFVSAAGCSKRSFWWLCHCSCRGEYICICTYVCTDCWQNGDASLTFSSFHWLFYQRGISLTCVCTWSKPMLIAVGWWWDCASCHCMLSLHCKYAYLERFPIVTKWKFICVHTQT